jgi:DNA-binding IclR family transcriptional regulator
MATKIYLEASESGDEKIQCEGRSDEMFSLLISALGKVLYSDLGRDKSIEEMAAVAKKALTMNLRKCKVEDLIQRNDPRAGQEAQALAHDLLMGLFDVIGGDGHAMH